MHESESGKKVMKHVHLSLDLRTFATTHPVNVYLFSNLRTLFSLHRRSNYLSLILYDYYTHNN
jgi:hypothetical protein